MIPILANSNGVSGLPEAVAQPVSGQRGTGGFALTFAAAQGPSAASPAAAGEVQAPDGPGAESAGAATNLKASIPGWGISQFKKSLNGDSSAGGRVAAMNTVVPGFTPAPASQIPPPPPQPSLTPASLLQPVPAPALSADVQTQLQTSTSNAVASSIDSGYSGSSRTIGSLGPATSDGTSNLLDQSTPSVLIPPATAGQANMQETSIADNLPAAFSTAAGRVTAGAVLPDLISGNRRQGSQDELLSARSPLPESPLASVFSTASPASASGTVLPNADSEASWSLANGSGLGSGEAMPQTNHGTEIAALDPTVTDPTLLAEANSAGATAAPVLPAFAANPKAVQATLANGVVTGTTGQDNVASQTGPANPLSAILGRQISPPTNFNPAAQPATGRTALQFVVPRVTTAFASPGVREVGQGAGSGTSSSVASSLAASGSGFGSLMANQTPFSVFFSGPGPGTEAAASALPKMILPVTGSALRDGHSGANAGSANPQAGGLPGSTLPGSASPNAVPPNLKDSITGAASGVSQTQPLRRDVDLTAANVQFAASQTGATPTLAPPAPAAAVLAVGGPAAPVTDALPKPDPLPAAATPASTAPLPAETLVAAVPGPVQVAQMVNRIGQAEMRIGMNTSAFGSVEVRTVVHANDVGLVIGSEKGDLRTLLSNDMPAITNTLQQQNLRLNSVNFMQGFAFSNNASGGGDSQQRSFVPAHAFSNSGLPENPVDDSVELPLAEEFGGGSSLSILA